MEYSNILAYVESDTSFRGYLIQLQSCPELPQEYWGKFIHEVSSSVKDKKPEKGDIVRVDIVVPFDLCDDSLRMCRSLVNKHMLLKQDAEELYQKFITRHPESPDLDFLKGRLAGKERLIDRPALDVEVIRKVLVYKDTLEKKAKREKLEEQMKTFKKEKEREKALLSECNDLRVEYLQKSILSCASAIKRYVERKPTEHPDVPTSQYVIQTLREEQEIEYQALCLHHKSASVLEEAQTRTMLWNQLQETQRCLDQSQQTLDTLIDNVHKAQTYAEHISKQKKLTKKQLAEYKDLHERWQNALKKREKLSQKGILYANAEITACLDETESEEFRSRPPQSSFRLLRDEEGKKFLIYRNRKLLSDGTITPLVVGCARISGKISLGKIYESGESTFKVVSIRDGDGHKCCCHTCCGSDECAYTEIDEDFPTPRFTLALETTCLMQGDILNRGDITFVEKMNWW